MSHLSRHCGLDTFARAANVDQAVFEHGTLQRPLISEPPGSNTAQVYDSGYSTFASNLIHLKMQKGNLDMLHARGLMACVALQSFEISEDCTIIAEHWVDCLDTVVSTSGDISVSADLSSLACLTDLRSTFQSQGYGQVASDLCGLGTLPCLQSLHLVVPGHVNIGPAFERLNKLISLYVGCVKRSDHFTRSLFHSR